MQGSHIALFAGVGMTDIAAERAGFKTIATAEIDPWNRKVLVKRFPDAAHYSDVKHVTASDLLHSPDLKRPLLISGGFPCQDVSPAGSGQGLEGTRSGLWSEFKRVISELTPEYVLIENSSMLRSRGLDVVLADLDQLGYDARWDCIPAAAVGAPHLRDRVFIVAWKSAHLVVPPIREDWLGNVFQGRVIRKENLHMNFITKLPRAGRLQDGQVYTEKPQAPIADARKACLSHAVPCPATPTGAWPTPAASMPNDGEAVDSWLARREQLKEKRINGNGAGMPLSVAVTLFPTPKSSDSKRSGHSPAEQARKSPDLPAIVVMFPTPTKSDGSGGPGTSPRRMGGKNLRTVVAESDGNGRLNPAWVEWLMGLPIGWTSPVCDNDALRPHDGWETEMDLPRTLPADAMKDRAKRIRALGNGMVWQCAAVALTMIPDLKELSA